MNTDHKVAFRSYETLVSIVMGLRHKHGIDHLCEFNIFKLMSHYVSMDQADVSKTHLILFEEESDPFFNRIQNTLNVNKYLWAEALIGEPLACFMLLHELAHILLHKHPKYSFSRTEHSGLKFISDEESAEWQANVFAAVFMAPPYLALDCNDRKSIAKRFNYPSEFIGFWMDLRARHNFMRFHSLCSFCGGHQLRVGAWARCNTCGKITKHG